MGSKEPTTAGDKFPPFWSQLLQIIQSDVALGKRWWWKTRVARLEPRQRQVMAQVAIYQLKFCLTTRTPRKRTQARSQKKKKNKNDERSHNKLFKRLRGFSFSLLPLFWPDQYDIGTCPRPLSSPSVEKFTPPQCNAATFSVIAACLFPRQRIVPSANKWSAN